MGQAESKEVIADGKFEKLKQIATRQGPAAVLKYLKDNVNQWKEEKVLFAVTGSGNTTKEPTAYQNPQNKRIVFYDLPGIGTMEFPKATYAEKMELERYDYFFIFFDKVVSEDDYFLVCMLINMKKSFCLYLVRSKIDEDLRNAEDDGKREEEVIPGIREKINEQISRYEHLKNSDAIFLISSKKKDMGDWKNLLHHIEKCLPPPKFETFMKRIKLATLASACIAAAPVPGLDVVANIALLVEEVVHYINVFGLSKERLEALDGLDRKKLNCASFHIQDLPEMGKAESKELTKDDEYAELRVIAEKQGPSAVSKYLQEHISQCKNEKVAFAITGRTATGKSTFINKMNNVNPGDIGFAKSGSGNTTKNQQRT
ncbi:unnamed protein product [Mytilus edulis]|uniref:IRG-type G domain-containing protein n=1 Tax=Mytilus edulis TaxID=6550 RepID=A0A8S3RYQ3_MYTED|nr:unnamed protein product [Mytilus edulis]